MTASRRSESYTGVLALDLHGMRVLLRAFASCRNCAASDLASRLGSLSCPCLPLPPHPLPSLQIQTFKTHRPPCPRSPCHFPISDLYHLVSGLGPPLLPLPITDAFRKGWQSTHGVPGAALGAVHYARCRPLGETGKHTSTYNLAQ